MTLEIRILSCSSRLFIITLQVWRWRWHYLLKNAYFHYMQTWFHVQLDRKILKGLYSTHHCVNIFPPAGRLMMGRILNRDLPRFFDQVGHQTTNASIGSIFSLYVYNDRQAYQIMNNLVKDLKILSFQVNFQCLKLVESFKKNYMKNTWLQDQLIVRNFFENFEF